MTHHTYWMHTNQPPGRTGKGSKKKRPMQAFFCSPWAERGVLWGIRPSAGSKWQGHRGFECGSGPLWRWSLRQRAGHVLVHDGSPDASHGVALAAADGHVRQPHPRLAETGVATAIPSVAPSIGSRWGEATVPLHTKVPQEVSESLPRPLNLLLQLTPQYLHKPAPIIGDPDTGQRGGVTTLLDPVHPFRKAGPANGKQQPQCGNRPPKAKCSRASQAPHPSTPRPPPPSPGQSPAGPRRPAPPRRGPPRGGGAPPAPAPGWRGSPAPGGGVFGGPRSACPGIS